MYICYVYNFVGSRPLPERIDHVSTLHKNINVIVNNISVCFHFCFCCVIKKRVICRKGTYVSVQITRYNTRIIPSGNIPACDKKKGKHVIILYFRFCCLSRNMHWPYSGKVLYVMYIFPDRYYVWGFTSIQLCYVTHTLSHNRKKHVPNIRVQVWSYRTLFFVRYMVSCIVLVKVT